MGDLNIKQKLTALIQKGLIFELSDDKLRVKGDLSALSNDDKQFLKENKPAVISLIEKQTRGISVIKKVDKSSAKPLSFSQQSLWLLDKINNGSAHYNLSTGLKLKGKIDYNALNQTFLKIVERHKSLRSCFYVNEDGQPQQKIQAANKFKVQVENLERTKRDNKAAIRENVEAEVHRVFDLSKDILLSVRLLVLKPEEHILIVTMHHIASDGWSMGILINEFNALYTAYVKAEANPLPPLSIQYTDYSSWQREWLTGKVLEEHSSYWKSQLADLPILHNLPLDRPRPVVQSFNGNVYSSKIDKKVLDALQALCRAEGASLFMGLHAAYSSLLARYSNEKDIVIGSPIANREKAETANLVGFFMNLLVLRSDFSQNPSFKELLRQSKEMLENAYEYQQMPFEKIVEILNVNRNLSHNPVFQILLTLQNNQQGTLSLSDVSMEPIDLSFGIKSAKYDLSLDVSESADGLRLSWEYNTDLFDEATIAGMAEHFNILLSSLLENQDENVFKVKLVEASESAVINKHLAGEKLKLTKADRTVHLFYRQVKNKAKEIAIINNDVSFTYKQLGERVDTIAQLLIKQGAKKGDKIGICLVRNIDLVATIFACFKLGAAYIPLDPIYPAERINQIIEDAHPAFIVSLNSLKKLYLDTLSTEQFVSLDNLKMLKGKQPVAVELSDEAIAYVIFTSGTTGRPKGIEVTHGNLDNLLKGFDRSYGSKNQQKWLAQTSMNFDISVLELIGPISRGQTIVLQQTNPFKLLAPDRLAPAKKLDFSVMFFGADKSKEQKYDVLLETTKFADKNNFTAIWTPERHFGEFGGAFPSPAVLSSALAVLTKNISIRSGSVVLPLHDPVRVAEEWSLIDNLSNGRVGISIASGWQPDDFALANNDFKDRHQRMREKIVELKDLWNGKPVTRKNGVGVDFAITTRPRPIQKELPMWITAAGSPETFKYAGKIGANLLTHMLGQTQEKLADNIAVYHKALIENGHQIEDKKVTLMLHTYIDSSEQAALEISDQPFKDYLGSSMKLMAPLAKELGIDLKTQSKEIIEIAAKKFSKENTLIGSPESSQKMLFSVQKIGVTEIACLVDFGVESEKVLKGLEQIVETRNLYQSYAEFIDILNTENQKTELDLIGEYKLSHVQMTPSQSKLVLDLYHQANKGDLSSVQHWFIGGEALNQNLIKGLSKITDSKFYNMYGPTETTVWSAWREINPENIHIGEPIVNTDLLLLNEFEQEVPTGVVGELYIGGAGVAKGYHENTELTHERFRKISNTSFAGGRFYKTGDLMKLNGDGTFEYVGRKDNQVKVNGYRIELEEIEKTIAKVAGIKHSKVVPIVNNNSTALAAYVVKEDVVYGNYKPLPPEKQAKRFHFADGSYVYHQSDRQLAMLYQEIIEDGIYFKHGIRIPENGLVFDLGANIGTFSIDVNRRHPSATVIAFEPIPQIFSGLKKNFEHRQINGRVLNYGVSNKKENATFHYYPEMAGMSGRFADKETIVEAVGQYMQYDKKMMKNGENHLVGETRKVAESFYENIQDSDEFKDYLSSLYKAEQVDCQLTTVSDIIDELNIQKIDLLKLDVEKSECLVLEGIRPEHWPMIRHLAVEVDGDKNLEIIQNLLKEKAYDVNVEVLILSDTEVPREENTYMLYATNLNHGAGDNGDLINQLRNQANEPEIRAFLKQQLPDYMIPKNMHMVSSIPLMGNGKVDMEKLKEFKPEKIEAEVIPELTNKTEIEIFKLWCEVLKKDNIPYHVSIFEAGGNSIEVVLLHEKLQKKFEINFSLIELFRNPTIPQQAKLVQNADSHLEKNTSKKAMNKGLSRRNARAKKLKMI